MPKQRELELIAKVLLEEFEDGSALATQPRERWLRGGAATAWRTIDSGATPDRRLPQSCGSPA